MKILSWDLNEEKNSPDLVDIINTLQDHNSDIIFLHEFINDRNGQIIRNAMKELGWEYQYFTGAGTLKGILILSTKHFSHNRCNYRKPTKSYGWLDIIFHDLRIGILAVNIPKEDWHINHSEYWELLLEYSKVKTVDDCLIIGSLAPEHKEQPYFQYHPIKEMVKTGWVDLIKCYQNKSGNNDYYDKLWERKDYAFASRMAKKSIQSAYISPIERKMGFFRLPVILELMN